MPNTYSQISIHCVFAVKHRQNFLQKSWREDVFSYINGIMRNIHLTPLAVGGWVDHVHVFFGLPTSITIADAMRDIKANSSRFITENKLVAGKFQWQEGYGAFSYSKSQRDGVINYIMEQEKHHAIKTFREEYLEMLQKFEVSFDEQYLFEFYD